MTETFQKKQIKLVVLINDQKLVTQIEEVLAELGDPNCRLVNPYQVGPNDTLSPWLSDCTTQDTFMISSDKILTLTDPRPVLLEKYESLTK